VDFGLADDLNIKGLHSYRIGDYKQSLKYFQKSLRIRLKLFGENHADVAKSYYNIAVSYH
jgi:hypothetical protein